jgi:DNA-binding MarR family transcriptional regulator
MLDTCVSNTYCCQQLIRPAVTIQSRVQQSKFQSLAQEALVSLLVAAALVEQRTSDLLRPYGLTHDQYNVLRILRGAHPDGHPRLEVGKRMMSRAPDVTRILDRLERQGLVERGWAPENRRLSIARITAEGLELLATIDPLFHATQLEATHGLSEAELRAFIRTCERIAR